MRGGAAGGVSAGGAVFRVKAVHCDLAECTTSRDVYERVLSALDATDWHSRNLDALWESVAGGGINGLVPPYRIEVDGYGGLPKELRDLVDRIGALFLDARRDRDADVAFDVD